MSSIFFSVGADPYAHIRNRLDRATLPAFEGTWTTVELQPDVFARQKYTVGVVVAGLQGEFSFQLLDDMGRFECLFGKDYVSELRTLMESAEHTLLRAQGAKTILDELHFDSESICLGDIWPTAGASISSVVSRLYFDMVPFIPTEEKKTRDFTPLDNATVRLQVSNELKRIAGLAFENIVTEPIRQYMDSVGVAHRLEFNLEPGQKVGNVISAVYKTPDRVELNFLRASSDLATYAKLKNLDAPAIFVMTPSETSMPREDRIRIENVLEEQSWNLANQGFLISAHDSAADLAADIWEWSGFK